jgi:hypothetical protein
VSTSARPHRPDRVIASAALLLSALLAGCRAKPEAAPRIAPEASDPQWARLLKASGLKISPRPDDTKAELSYRLRAKCPLVYSARLTEERDEATDAAPASLPAWRELAAEFRLLPTDTNKVFLSLSSAPLESGREVAPGIWLDHLRQGAAPLTLSATPEALVAAEAARASWEYLGDSFGASIFFPIMTGGAAILGEGWDAPFAAAVDPEDPLGRNMPWRAPAAARFRFDGVYEIKGERAALILASWSREGTWTSPDAADSPRFEGKETGQASYLFLVDRGWPLLSEVFVQRTEEVLSPDAPRKETTRTFLGLSYLREACAGPTVK